MRGILEVSGFKKKVGSKTAESYQKVLRVQYFPEIYKCDEVKN